MLPWQEVSSGDLLQSDAAMPKYLEQLSVRLASGMARVPEAFRQRHADFLLAAQRPDGGFSGREGQSDLYYTGFAMRAMALLGVLDGPVASDAAKFLKQHLSDVTPPSVDLMSLIFSRAVLKMSAGIDVFDQCEPQWQDQVAREMESLRRDDGGYARSSQSHSSSTYHTFLIVLGKQLLEVPVDPGPIVQFVQSRQRDDGGFVEIGPMKNSGTNPTAAAIGLLKILETLDESTAQNAINYLATRQSREGGIQANTRIGLADLLSTFTGLLTLADLGGLDQIDLEALTRYVQQMERSEGGFLGGIWDDTPDVEYTYYGLGATGLLADAPLQ